MQKVEGLGGLFFRARDPKALAEWYETHLGVNQTPTDANSMPWMQAAGPTVFAPFSEDTDYFGRDSQQWMINFRVGDLNAMVTQLESAGIEIGRRDDMEGIGRFARIHDPEGNPIELWEPAS